MKRYIKEGIVTPANVIVIIKDGYQIINPTEEEILSDGWVEYTEPQPTEKELLEQAINNKLAEVNSYDTGEEVNSFTYKGIKMWFSKADRVGLRNSLDIEKSSGREESTMWFGDTPLKVNISEGLELLKAIELYALDCYNTTAKHKSEIKKLKSIEDIEKYNFKQGYPEKLVL